MIRIGRSNLSRRERWGEINMMSKVALIQQTKTTDITVVQSSYLLLMHKNAIDCEVENYQVMAAGFDS